MQYMEVQWNDNKESSDAIMHPSKDIDSG